MRTSLEPGGGSDAAYSLQVDSIFALAIRGSLELVVHGTPRHLQSGDSLTFPARSAHEWSDPGPVDAEVVWVITPPLPRQELFPARKKRGTAAG
ncbi:cupin domain-containing protein [Streptomyces sp. NPDC055059]|uniref:cupin domain-containing protein n=1 Tax=unclassified Streptomyces TaxID=2593676 RepID=UPI0033BD7D2C